MVKKVNLLEPIDVDKIDIRKDEYFPNAYIIDLPLDSEPDHAWQDIFEREWMASTYLWDRKIFVIGDMLRLITPPQEIEEKINWVREVIAATNKSVENHSKRKAWRTRAESEVQRELAEHREAIQLMRDAVKRALHR